MRSFPQFFLELFWRISANGEIGRAFSRTSGWKSAVPVSDKKKFHPRGINVLLTYVQDALGGIRESRRHISRLEFISCRIQKCTSKLVGLAAREGQARCLFCSFSAALDLSHQPRLAFCFLAILSIIKKRWGGAFGRVVECGHKCLPQTASNKIPCRNHPCPVFAANSEWLMLEAVMKSYDDSSGAATAAALRLHTRVACLPMKENLQGVLDQCTLKALPPINSRSNDVDDTSLSCHVGNASRVPKRCWALAKFASSGVTTRSK